LPISKEEVEQIKQKKGRKDMRRRGDVRIGTSGWHYGHWVGPFYPDKTSSRDMLAFYLRHFDTVEVNNSFYRLPDPETFKAWKKNTPPDFEFAVKGSRFLTHMKKLKEPETGIREFFAAADLLGKKLGPTVFQLPPFWKVNPERLREFLQALPRGRHRYAFEFRNPTWHTPEILSILRARNAAFCIFDIGRFQSPLELTADFAYVRLHGPRREKYQGSYSRAALTRWAERIRAWRSLGKDVYLYFDNDQKGYAPANAETLKNLLRGDPDSRKNVRKTPEKQA
jgi:uncharacterized protein YecE (DUF72 family)